MNGYHTEIFELHDLPGGLCTAWERKDYVFDGCIHYLFGTAPGAPFNQLWHELGLADRPFIHHEEMLRVIGPDGKTLIAYADPNRLAAHMKELSPADARLIDEATPLSHERCAGNWQGSSCGWLLTKNTMLLMIKGMEKTLPGLDNFYLAGQWVEPGGSVPIVATSGRNAIQMICHDDRRPFVTVAA
jgi:phytoene dehydrogenase-like protein